MQRNDGSNWKRDWESIMLPVILIVTGLVLVAASCFGIVSLDRIQNLWPVALILVGLSEMIPSSDSARR